MTVTTLFEVRNDRLHPIQRRFHVDGHHLVELLVREVENGRVDSAPGVVDPYVDRAEGAKCLVAQTDNVGATSDVRDYREGITMDVRANGFERVGTSGGENEPELLAAESPRERGADAAASPRDHGDWMGLHIHTVWQGSSSSETTNGTVSSLHARC